MSTNSRFALWLRIWTAVLLLVAVIGIADYATGYEIHFSALYLAPIGIAAWYFTLGEAVVVAVLCAAVEYAADYCAGLVYSSGIIGVADTGVFGSVFITVAFAIHKIRESRAHYRDLFENMMGGYLHCRLLFDQQGRAIDFVYLDVNQTFSRLTGLDGVIGKRAGEVTPAIRNSNPNLLEILARVSRTGIPERTEIEFGSLGRWFSVSVYAPRAQQLIALLDDITDQKRAERVLRESEELFRGTFENAAVSISLTDREGRWLAFNEKLCEMLGYTKAELLRMRFREVTHGDDLPEDWEQYLRLMRGEINGYHIEKRYLRKDGKLLWVEIQRSLMRDKGGEGLHAINIVQDVTSRKEAEDALRESERNYRIVADNTYAWEFWLDPDGSYRYVSPSCFRWTGYEAKELITDPCLIDRIIYPEDRAKYQEHRGGEHTCATEEAEFRIVRRDGAVRWIEHTCTKVYDDAGTFLGTRGSNRDITDRKRVEDKLQQSELRFRTMADDIPQLAWIARADGWVYWFNRRWFEYTGTTLEQVEGWGWQVVHEPGTLPAVLARWRASLDSGEPFEMTYPLRGGDGLFRPFLTRVMPLKDERGRIMQWFGTNTDVSEQKHLEEELRAAQISAERAKEAAEQANAAKDQFLAVLSHELRTPLAPVLAGLSLLKRKCGACGVSNELEILERNVQLEARLIDDLLDLTRIERGKISLDRKPVEIGTVLGLVVEICRPALEARTLHLEVKLEEPLYPVYGDPVRLQQVFWNLLNNAIKFTDPGGSICIRGRSENGRVTVEVADNGIGIEAEAMTRIFGAFEQADSRTHHRFGGLGLGLAISKRLVEMHGGTIGVESAGRNQGCTFRVAFPCLAGLYTPEAKDVPQELQPSAKRILLVEDHADTSTLMKELLEIAGYDVEAAMNVAQALEAIRRRDFDIVISDLGLPDRSGLELMWELRRRRNPIKGIALTGFGREEDVKRSKEVGFSEHLIKPVDFNLLLAAVARVVEGEL